MGKNKKSNSQINRMKRRAAARGEEYVPIILDYDGENVTSSGSAAADAKNHDDDDGTKKKDDDVNNNLETKDDDEKNNKVDNNDDDDNNEEKKKQLYIAAKLYKEITKIDDNVNNEYKNTKERRSAKRRAEAIASESINGNMTGKELLELYSNKKDEADEAYVQLHHKTKTTTTSTTKEKKENMNKKKKNPYIVFVGQLSYKTTKEDLFQHIKNELHEDIVESNNNNSKDGNGEKLIINSETIQIRLLTETKNPTKSRGMAFVETTNPELLYLLLKLHHTNLNGRRINIERTAGGRNSSKDNNNKDNNTMSKRNLKIQQYRKEQETYISDTIMSMIDEYKQKGLIAQENELDDGVVALCKRHSPHIIELALNEYIESKHSFKTEMDNPSAYLTFIIGRIATTTDIEERTRSKRKDNNNDQQQQHNSNKRQRQQQQQQQQTSSSSSNNGLMGKKVVLQQQQKQSEFAKNGIDMSISDKNNNNNKLSKIFPSMANRGGGGSRGRGRGYMR